MCAPPSLSGACHVSVAWPLPAIAVGENGENGTVAVSVVTGCDRQQHRRSRRLREVEVGGEVAEDPPRSRARRARVGPAVGLGVEAPAAEEVVFDELRVRVEAQRLMIDVAALGVRADHDARHAQPVAVLVDDAAARRGRRSRPSRPTPGRSRSSLQSGLVHHRVDEARDVRLPGAHRRRRVLAHLRPTGRPTRPRAACRSCAAL